MARRREEYGPFQATKPLYRGGGGVTRTKFDTYKRQTRSTYADRPLRVPCSQVSSRRPFLLVHVGRGIIRQDPIRVVTNRGSAFGEACAVGLRAPCSPVPCCELCSAHVGGTEHVLCVWGRGTHLAQASARLDLGNSVGSRLDLGRACRTCKKTPVLKTAPASPGLEALARRRFEKTSPARSRSGCLWASRQRRVAHHMQQRHCGGMGRTSVARGSHDLCGDPSQRGGPNHPDGRHHALVCKGRNAACRRYDTCRRGTYRPGTYRPGTCRRGTCRGGPNRNFLHAHARHDMGQHRD